MPLKLNVGLSKKVGQPNYGSLGASCHVEIELDQSLIFSDLDGFHERVRNTFVACRQAVQDELSRFDGAATGDTSADARGRGSANGVLSDNGSHCNGNVYRASEKQVDYARQLAGQIRGLGIRRLETLANRLHHRPLADLSSLEASTLIDALKDIKAGKISLGHILNGAAA
ncbi:MAG TPA: hypothetical protein VGY55_00525 [Pirellulales bacterium]|jgi:hypothetical protein|nr:hypothetical protein [Pirellulales bacterium]